MVMTSKGGDAVGIKVTRRRAGGNGVEGCGAAFSSKADHFSHFDPYAGNIVPSSGVIACVRGTDPAAESAVDGK